MGDGLKLSKDKRHRSSSSLGGTAVEGTRSERKLDLAESIAEVDDQFALAEARCENLQEKIDLVKVVKKKKKLKKLSMTRVNEVPVPPENMSYITVKTQPKKKAIQTRQRRPEVPSLNSAAEEQRQMLGQMRGYNEAYYEPQHQYQQAQTTEPNRQRTRDRRARADGDRVMCGRSVQIDGPVLAEPRPPDDVDTSDYEEYHQNEFSPKKPSPEGRPLSPKNTGRRRHVPRDVPIKTVREKWKDRTRERGWHASPDRRAVPAYNNFTSQLGGDEPGERPVVELFSNNMKTAASNVSTRQPVATERKLKKDVRDGTRRGVRPVRDNFNDQRTGPLGDVSTQPVKNKEARHPHKLKYRCRRYELPTMASQMKQAGARYYQGTGAYPNIPFVVSKSTAPSHNIGVNIQQVLNGLKVQQPLTGIPPTIAHHMGLGHVSTFMVNNNIAPALSEHREINTIKLGRRLVRLPSQKYMSYNRALNLYREGDGMVPRFLRAISRPHYFYTSMYNLATTREDLDAATSKANNVAAQEAKQSLAEYASLYREYEQLDKTLREGNYEPEWERRRDEIWKELALREERVRKMVQDYKGSNAELAPLRASASTAEDSGRRRSCYKLGDQQH
ncbi:uncharacterized protein LOC125241258 isoform X2 [Leguminivora glycinivorella]|uniref:uncharacterized protein LOC125241258 isoform X2 n=1 Tax=Leguminivora glycinivorella TaxID=1035111 RepID=UPI00200BEFD1|nr:uncharacterized protein LOC125241258 isoform X2 [Leguminivora glycinivorella]